MRAKSIFASFFLGALCFTGQAYATVPTVTTNPATSVSANGATLNGTVNPNNKNITADTFNYGLTASYGSSVNATPYTVSSGSGNTTVSAAVSGLTCNTTYHFQVQAVNSSGTSKGADQSFTTSACSPSVTSINTASPDPTAPATAVSWTVTFNQSVTGVNTADFVLVPAGGVTGATITSVTGGGTTWTVTANTGSGYGTLGLNLVDDDTIKNAGNIPLGGVGLGNGDFTGQIYTIPAPLTCITDNFSTGTLDTTLWNVRTILGPYLPAVVNVGGGDNRLRLTDTRNNEATFAQLKRTFPAAGNKVVLEIDYLAYGGSGADGIAVTFSDATVSSTTGGFGGSLGYAQNNAAPGYPGFGGGWMGIGLDEYGNYPCTNESRTGYPAGWTDPVLGNVTPCTGSGGGNHYVAVRGSGSGTTGYNLLANTGLIAATAPAGGAAGATPYRYRFTLDHSDGVHAYVTVERDTTGTGASYTTLVPKFDAKGANSGQAAVPANWLVSFTGSTGGSTNNHDFKQVKICANTIVGGGPHHFEIQHASGTGVTCTPSTLTIKACADALVPCTPYTTGVSGTLTETGTPTVNWSGGTGFTIPAGSSIVTKDVQVTTVGSVVFDATSIPSPTTVTICNFGTPACTFTSADSALLLSAPNHAAESLTTLTIQAVKSAPGNPLVCVPGMTGTKTVNLKCSYTNPATGTLPVRVAGAAINAAGNAASACDAGGRNVSLTFDSTGVATPSLQYADVGQMSATASYTGAAGSIDAGLSMAGSGSFIAAPASFGFSSIIAGPIKSGNNFSATITAKNSAGNTTPNFGKEAAPEGVTLTSNLASGNNPAPANNVIAGTEFGAGGMVNDANGVATVNNLSWGEVGNITLTANLTSGSYLASGLTASGTSASVGAFIPDHFDTAVIATATTPMPCPTGLTCPILYNGFVYSGQPFSEQVTARNLAGGTTTNYHSAYGLSNNVTLSAWDALGSVVTQNPPGGTGSLTNGTLASTAFSSGVGLTSTQAYTFASSPTAPTDIFLRAVDAVNTTVTSRRATPATSVEGGVKVVNGRIKIANAHGSELLPLPITVTAQFWNAASGWITSSTDSVSSFAAANVVFSNCQKLSATSTWPTTCPPPTSVSPASVVLVNGVGNFKLSAPGAGKTGSVNMVTSVPIYLPSNTARATFGVYKGDNDFIYLRENY